MAFSSNFVCLCLQNLTMLRVLANFGSNVFRGSTLTHLSALSPNLSNLLTKTPPLTEQTRTVTKFSIGKGKRKTVRAVVDRFFRLHWGGWIRTKAGRHKKLWSKTPVNRRMLREHVLCNGTQSKLLDRMVSAYWRKPKHYIEDPYTPYHTREEFWITRQKPWRPAGWE